jgi:hypothetical protein
MRDVFNGDLIEQRQNTISAITKLKAAKAATDMQLRLTQKRLEKFNEEIKKTMDECGLVATEDGPYYVGLRDGSTFVHITDESLLPQGSYKVVIVPDKEYIARQLKEGVDVPGAELRRGPTSVLVKRLER